MPKLRAVGPDDSGVFMPREIVMHLVDELLPYALNSRDHPPAQVEQIVNSIKRYGWTNPVLVADGGIMAGHGRLLAAHKLGLRKVPCIDISYLSADDRRAYVIADNRIAENAVWGLEALKAETDYLRDVGYDLERDLGFAEDDLAALLEGLGPAPEPGGGDGDPDEVPAPPEHGISQRGDVWICGAHRVMCGSALEIADWQHLLDGELADVVVTDPPYNCDQGRKNREQDKWDGGNRSATGSIENDKMSGAEFARFLGSAFDALFQVMKAGAPIYVAHSDIEGGTFRAAFDGAGFKFQSSLVWKKQTMVLGRLDWQSIHEPIMYGWKPGSKHRWYGGRKNTSVIDLGDGGPFTQLPDGRWQIKIGDSVMVVDGAATVEQFEGSVICEPKPSKSGLHPTQKPVALIERMLKQSARAGDIVVDAFGGSGTTLVAADRMGMCARLMEIDPEFVDTIVMRWQALTGRRAVHADTGEEFPLGDEERQAAPEPELAEGESGLF